jgi:2-polyprenyl-3-methyl-5-hydroxy-6-metoxy-1,4-benzoquinol methylase
VRPGNPVVIPGDYQYRAATRGPAIQRFWHYTKRLAIERYLPPGPDDFVLDAGCGSGVITAYLGESGARVIGLDPNSDSIAFAKRMFGRANVTFINAAINDLVVDRPLDKIYNLEVIEHLTASEGREMLQRFYEALRPGGMLFLTTPNVRSLWPLIEWTVDRTGLVPQMGGAQHVEMYHSSKLRDLAAAVGFEVRAIRSICLLSPWTAAVSWRAAHRLFDLEASLPGVLGPVLISVFGRPRFR